MKKILMLALLGCMALNFNVYSMEKKQEKQQKSRVQFTKMDWAKLTAASLGCGWFSLVRIGAIVGVSDDMSADNPILIPLGL